MRTPCLAPAHWMNHKTLGFPFSSSIRKCGPREENLSFFLSSRKPLAFRPASKWIASKRYRFYWSNKKNAPILPRLIGKEIWGRWGWGVFWLPAPLYSLFSVVDLFFLFVSLCSFVRVYTFPPIFIFHPLFLPSSLFLFVASAVPLFRFLFFFAWVFFRD